jgi:hypothetical protein
LLVRHALPAGKEESIMRNFIISLAALAALPANAQAGRFIDVTYMCDLGGVPARLIARVEVMADCGATYDRNRGAIPICTGSKISYSGRIVSQTGAAYTFTGGGAYASFSAVGWSERFHVRFDARGDLLQMTINPENGRDATTHMCRLVRR